MRMNGQVVMEENYSQGLAHRLDVELYDRRILFRRARVEGHCGSTYKRERRKKNKLFSIDY